MPVSGKGIKGFLIRLGHSPESSMKDKYDLTGALSPPGNETDAQAIAREARVEDLFCANEQASGLTHNDAQPKYLIEGNLLITEDIPNEGDLLLDVTVVLSNDDTKSEYYYSQFPLKAFTITAAPTKSPGPKYLVYGSDSSATTTLSKTTIVIVTAMAVGMGGWIMTVL